MNIFRKIVLLAVVGMSLNNTVEAQCNQPSSVNTTTTNITCRNSGAITITNVMDGSNNITGNCRFTLYDATNTSVVAIEQSGLVFNNLAAGTYTLHVKQVCTSPAGTSLDLTKTVTITGTYTDPVLGSSPTITAPVCGADAKIQIFAVKGYGSYSFCLVDSLNAPQLPAHYVAPPQSNSTFSNLTAGTYYMRVYDACGSYVTSSTTINRSYPPAISSVAINSPVYKNCDSAGLNISFWGNGITNGPTNPVWVIYPDGTTDTILAGAINRSNFYYFYFPISKISAYYPATVTVGYRSICDSTSTATLVYKKPRFYLKPMSGTSYDCNNSYVTLGSASFNLFDSTGYTMFSLPGGKSAYTSYSLDSGATWKPYSTLDSLIIPNNQPLKVMVTICGQVYSTVITPAAQPPLTVIPYLYSKVSCAGKTGLMLYVNAYTGPLDSVRIHVVSQPAAQPPIPDYYYMYSKYNTMNPAMLSIAPGTYSLQVSDRCRDTTFTITIDGNGKNVMNAYAQYIPCAATGSIVITDTNTRSTVVSTNWNLKYEIYNSSNQLVRNGTGYGSASTPVIVTETNLSSGVYTVQMWRSTGSYSTDTICGRTVIPVTLGNGSGVFSMTGTSFAKCTNDITSGTIIVQTNGGTAPYSYSLYKGAAIPANLLTTQSATIFNGLDANATYTVTAIDQCGSGTSVAGTFNAVKPPVLTSSAVVPCIGDAFTMSTYKTPGMTYQWMKNNIAIPGATDTSYKIASMQMADSGAYVLSLNTGTSCLLLSTPMQLNPKVCNVPIPLAIKLINFSGYINAQNDAYLQWQIANPEPGGRFEILYATDGKNFSSAGTVLADGESTRFNLTHYYPIGAKTYYKLLMTDKDGTQRYSNVIVLQGGSKLTANSMTTAPMPFTSYININYTTANSGLVTFTIMDMNGRTLITRQTGLNTGVNSVNIAGLEMLPGGIYLLQAVNAQGEKQTVKIQK